MIPDSRRRPRQMRPLLLLAGSALLLMAAACQRAPEDAVAAPRIEGERIVFAPDSPQLGVLHSAPAARDAAPELDLPARLAWDDTRTGYLRAAVPGVVAAIEAAPGDRVEAGQVLAWIASPDYAGLRADGIRGDAELRQARNELARVRELHAAGVASGRELDEARTALAAAEAEHGRSAAGLRAFGGGSGNDPRLPLRAPLAGTVLERRLSPGMTVGPDDEAPLVVVGDPARLWLLVDIPEHLAGAVQAGMRVRVDAGGEPLQATLQHVADHIDPERRVVAARAELDNAARRFKAGQLLRARVTLADDAGLAVPSRSLLQADGRQVVFVEEAPGRYRRQPVQAQLLAGGRARIAAGLDADARVVVDGSLLLQQLLDQGGTGGVDDAQGAP